MKKALCLLLAFTMILPVLAGCASPGAVTTDSPLPTEPTVPQILQAIPREEFWLAQEALSEPSDLVRTQTDRNVSHLYQDLLEGTPENVVLTSGEQALALEPRGDGTYCVNTYIVNGEDYIPMFASGEPIVTGLGYPTAWEIRTVDGNETCVMTGDGFTLTCTAMAKEGLFRFSLDATFEKALNMSGVDFGMTMEGSAEISYAQMPASIYGDLWGYENVGIAMPAAYLWDRGREAVILFDYTDMTWMGHGVYTPGRDGYVTAAGRWSNTLFGLCCSANASGVLPAGMPMTMEFYLWSGLSAQRKGIDCIARKAEVMESVHPAMVNYPAVREDLADTVSLNWEVFADGTVDALLHPMAYGEADKRLWDPILTSDQRGEIVYVTNARQTVIDYDHLDFSCNNNFLSSLAAYNRLNGREEIAGMISAKMDALQFYYDPKANMIRWGFNQGSTTEMPWQNFFYHVETWRASMLSADGDYSPAALSNLLASLEGVTEMLEKNDYVLSQFMDVNRKSVLPQQDVPALNIVYEPWQIGTYAYVCLKAYDMTGDEEYISLASTALGKVIDEVRFSVDNEAYTKVYTDSAEFPITEVFGTSYGTWAAYRLFELTGEEKYLEWSEGFFGMLSQLTFWYDDNFTEAARSSTILGLFEPHGGASHACPWETIEALLPLTEILDATGDYAFNDLILKLMNCQRVSSYNFYPVTWNEAFSGQDAYYESDFYFIPTEPLYNSIGGGNSGYGALYMSSLSFWNYLMYEAFAVCDDPDVMVLCTDIHGNFETAIRGAERSFVVYNPTGDAVTVTLTHRELPEGNYRVSVSGGETVTCSAAELMSGMNLTLNAGESFRVELTAEDRTALMGANQDVLTRYRMAEAYHALVEKVQSIARGHFAQLFPKFTEYELNVLADYVLTYMSYEDAMAHALDASSFSSLNNRYLQRTAVSEERQALYAENTDVHLPEEYSVLMTALDDAYVLFLGGNYTEAYTLCDSILYAVENGLEQALASELTAGK